jgi:NAD(P)H-dependent FMN reductase
MPFWRTRKKKKILLIQGSLSPYSKTAVLIHEAAACLKKKSCAYDVLDFRAIDIDICEHQPIETCTSDTQKAYTLMHNAHAYLFAVPVYAHSISGAVKNIVNLAHTVMEKKPVGILCYSDAAHSYSASLDFIQILSQKAHAVILKPVVHTYPEDFKKDSIYKESICQLIEELVDCLMRYTWKS